jgi:RNA polymerase sigma-70 factor (ECF subfamily)
MAEQAIGDEFAREMRAAWFRYLDAIESLRPALHRYCRRITGNVWDAEDLLQETLLRGFATIGRGDLHGEVSRVGNPRAYLFRTATNAWIDSVRHRQAESERERAAAGREAASAEDTIATRQAAAALIERWTPQERAALLLKDVFEFSLAEVADMLSTTVGAVKSALSRARNHAREDWPQATHKTLKASAHLLDRFVDALRAGDFERVTALLLDNVVIEVQGVGGERGTKTIWIARAFEEAARVERRSYLGEEILIVWCTGEVGGGVGDVWRVDEADGRIARILDYSYCPETLGEIAAELGVAAARVEYHQPAELSQGWCPARFCPGSYRSEIHAAPTIAVSFSTSAGAPVACFRKT